MKSSEDHGGATSRSKVVVVDRCNWGLFGFLVAVWWWRWWGWFKFEKFAWNLPTTVERSTQSTQNHHPKSNWNCKPKFTTHSQIQIRKEKEGGLEKKKKEEGKSEKERERRFREKERKSWRVFKGGWGHLGRC